MNQLAGRRETGCIGATILSRFLIYIYIIYSTGKQMQPADKVIYHCVQAGNFINELESCLFGMHGMSLLLPVLSRTIDDCRAQGKSMHMCV